MDIEKGELIRSTGIIEVSTVDSKVKLTTLSGEVMYMPYSMTVQMGLDGPGTLNVYDSGYSEFIK